MSNPINGTPVNFGFGSAAGITITEYSGILLQSAENSAQSDVEITRNGLGAEVTHGWHNLSASATLEFVVTGANLAGAITNSVLDKFKPGQFLTITACANMPDLVADSEYTSPTKWEVQPGARITGSNTASKRISVPLRRIPGITAVAT